MSNEEKRTRSKGQVRYISEIGCVVESIRTDNVLYAVGDHRGCLDKAEANAAFATAAWNACDEIGASTKALEVGVLIEMVDVLGSLVSVAELVDARLDVFEKHAQVDPDYGKIYPAATAHEPLKERIQDAKAVLASLRCPDVGIIGRMRELLKSLSHETHNEWDLEARSILGKLEGMRNE